ncbi:MAG TPA: DUF6585 family protein, partial [Patescibacteria group bacterium]|nr:DUF6585 family protein [Patescibacteria group bacterium]
YKITQIKNFQKTMGVLALAFFPGFAVTMVAFFGEPDRPNYTVATLAALITVSFTVFAVRYVASKKITLEINDTGITEFAKEKMTTISWADHELWHDAIEYWTGPIPLNTSINIKVTTPDGRAIEFFTAKPPLISSATYSKSAPDYQFYLALLEYSRDALLPRLRTRLHAGETLHFGPITLNNAAITIENNQYAFNQIKGLQVHMGKLEVKLQDKFFATKIKVKEIPNFDCLYRLLQEKTA